jgi:hypothetical protein
MCPTFNTIVSAVEGNENAIEKILNHYDNYICKSSLRPLYDDMGNMILSVDMEMKGRIRAAIIEMIYKFEISIV